MSCLKETGHKVWLIEGEGRKQAGYAEAKKKRRKGEIRIVGGRSVGNSTFWTTGSPTLVTSTSTCPTMGV